MGEYRFSITVPSAKGTRTEINMNIGDIIQNLREESGMLQSELAKQLGLGRTTISNYENNYSYPDLDTLISLSKLFNVSTDYLLGISNVRHRSNTASEEEAKILNYYKRLNSENRDYAAGEMIRLYREQEAQKKKIKNAE
ncbi:MAG: helix-turn-helix domain-containing protein [Clostridium sp.]|nr:helix-turn-helix domain-containing protein [Clostridium sp.]